MSVKLRMQRRGARHAAHYRIVAADSRSPRDGRYIELLGVYNPRGKEPEDELRLNLVRVEHWLSVGALPSDSVCSMIKRARRQPNEPLEELEEETGRVDSNSSEGKKAIEETLAEETTEAIAEDPVSVEKDGENSGDVVSDSVAKSTEEVVAETVDEAFVESEKSDNQEEDEEKSVS